MAVKKTSKAKDESAMPARVEAKESAPKKPTQARVSKAAAAPPVTAAQPAVAAPKPIPKKTAAKQAAAPIKLTDSQAELLKKIGGMTDAGYALDKKAEQRSIDSLLLKKLIKKGAKDKVTGVLRYHISSGGKKHIS